MTLSLDYYLFITYRSVTVTGILFLYDIAYGHKAL